jgi:signal transduction histidine kinase
MPMKSKGRRPGGKLSDKANRPVHVDFRVQRVSAPELSTIVTLGDACRWECDLRTSRVCLSDQLRSLLGIDGDAVPASMDEFLRLVHPDDHDRVNASISAIRSGNSVAHDLSVVPRTGGLLQVQARAVPICDRSGDIVSVVGWCRQAGNPSSAECPRHSDLLLAQAEQIANFGSWEFDVKSGRGTLSAHLAHIMGVEPDTKLLEEDYWSRVHPDDRAHVIEVTTAAIPKNKPFQYVARYFHPGGGVRHHFVRGLPIADGDGSPNLVVGITLDFSDQTHAEGELHCLSQRLMRARDEERRNVARELHESTGQTLAALKMSMGRLREALPEEDELLHTLLRSAVDLAEDAVREVRTLSYLMHPPMLDEAGLRSALHWYAKGFAERSGISVQVDIPEDFGRHGQEIETTVFRIVQEALTNVHRYSGSRTARIRLGRAEAWVVAEVQDEGCGLPSPNSAPGWSAPLGVGIVGIRERVKQLHGTFEMASAPGKGTTIRVGLPITSRITDPGTGSEKSLTFGRVSKSYLSSS